MAQCAASTNQSTCHKDSGKCLSRQSHLPHFCNSLARKYLFNPFLAGCQPDIVGMPAGKDVLNSQTWAWPITWQQHTLGLWMRWAPWLMLHLSSWRARAATRRLISGALACCCMRWSLASRHSVASSVNYGASCRNMRKGKKIEGYNYSTLKACFRTCISDFGLKSFG